ncbi:MBL fold metallo-hydrolase, partial [bacterium]
MRREEMMNFSLRLAPLAAIVAFSASSASALPTQAEVIPSSGGPIKITPIYHASMQIEYRGRVIQVDPFSAGDYTGAKKADYIFITHTHPDHLDRKAIMKVATKSTTIVAPPSAIKILEGYKMWSSGNFIEMGNKQTGGETNSGALTAEESKSLISFDSLASYNIVRGPKPGQKFHPKGQFNGYILKLGGKRIYIAGDTEVTPEMKALKNIDVAFLPMNLPYTMTPQEAAAGAKAFKPKVVYPYHYRYPFTKANTNPQQFQKALAGSGIQVRIRDWYK